VFDRFRQADAAMTRQHGGLGLGLWIVRHIVGLHGGTVRAESPGEGLGATFVVRLPIATTGPRPGPPAGAGAGGAISLGGLKVLVVDDEPDSRDVIRAMLEEQGAEVTAVDSAAAALDELPRARPDVLLSDIGMPQQDGYQLLRTVRALRPEQGGETPAAAVTAFARPEERQLALDAGYQGFVSKPVNALDLLRLVASLSGRGGRASA
jgi:CheY-like chemotaxis protein